MIYFLLGFIIGLVIALLIIMSLYMFRATTYSAVNDIKKVIVPNQTGGFIESEQTLADKKKEIWS